MINYRVKKLIKKSLLNNQILGAVLLFLYCAVYGITAQVVLAGLQMVFFLASLIFSLSVILIKDTEVQKAKAEKGIFVNQIIGTGLVFAYILVFGLSSLALLSGLQLVFFMSSYVFAMSLFYIRDKERIEKAENISCTVTSSPFAEKNPCFINSRDLSWLVRELNEALSTVIGFSELMLKREYGENEKEYIIRNIYEHGLSMSNTLNKAAKLIPDSPAKPKEIHEVVDLVNDKNFK